MTTPTLLDLAENARQRSAALDLQAGAARINGDTAEANRLAEASSYAWGVSTALRFAAGAPVSDVLAEVIGL